MINSFHLDRVQYVPKVLESGVLYVADDFDIAVHLCACGCGSKVTTPLGFTEWSVTEQNGFPTLRPSVGNWQLPCRSHYLITAGKTCWADQWSNAQIAAGRETEQRRREAHYSKRAQEQKWWFRLWRLLRGLLGI